MCSHVLRERRSAGKRLFTFWVFALIRALPCVRAAMPCKATRVTKCLATTRVFARVRFFACVYSLMYVKSGSLDMMSKEVRRL